MTNYRTCRGCAVDKNTCAFRQTVRETIKGLGVTSIKFVCAVRVPLFVTGQHVFVTWPFTEPGGDEYYPDQVEDVTFGATIIEETRPGRYFIKVDEGESVTDGDDYTDKDLNSGGFAKVSMTRLKPDTATDGVVEVCKSCQVPISQIEKHCVLHEPYTYPSACIAQQKRATP